ncbi:uncharacterized protein SAPINGB_P000293 [Magnusiomyces paraingens]|uniref:Uracil permease n=1 Tax=Magnusiomyces paraingens TaxID=2606893 RepID=A0A5E8B385_9ASCO|nr:uncharacterized protein SAPINGB_P000293 [Saprochaete ingens]VVT44082.1 unnamed protein product [Saprochaete ingens]
MVSFDFDSSYPSTSSSSSTSSSPYTPLLYQPSHHQQHLQQHQQQPLQISSKMGNFKEKFHNFLKKIETDHEPGLSNKQLFLENHDLLPVEPERRQWQWFNFVSFWIADSFNINTWQIASTGVAAGMTWWHVWISVWVGYTIAAFFVVLMGRIGSVYHISFPVASRSSFGVFGSYWPVINRAAMACIWYGVQAWLGSECVQLMILAIWPQAKNIPNHLEGSGTTTFEFMCFFLFCLGSLPAIWFPVHKIRHLFTVKSILVPFAGIGFLIWTIKRAGGIGPVVHQKRTLYGSTFAWAFVNSLMGCISNFATLIVNAPDFTRFAKKRSDAVASQLITIPLGFAITSFIGVIVSSASTVLVGETLWSPLDVLHTFLESGRSGPRCGVFFIAAVFCLAQLGTNISANSISAGTDMTALLPRFINIRRGGYICAAIGFAMCPWKLFESSNKFTTYLSAYSVFLSSIAGVIVSDYFLVRKGHLIVKDLYSFETGSTYMYKYGVSWKAYTAYICGILINVVGFAGATGRDVPIAAIRVYDLNFFGGFGVAMITYYGLCWAFPPPENRLKDKWSQPMPEEIEVAEGFADVIDEGASPVESVMEDEDEDTKKGGWTAKVKVLNKLV